MGNFFIDMYSYIPNKQRKIVKRGPAFPKFTSNEVTMMLPYLLDNQMSSQYESGHQVCLVIPAR